MRIVVTGSAGRIGRAIFVQLARDHDVVGLDRLPASTAVTHVGDVADRALLCRAFAGADAVVHVAALHAPHVGVVPDAEFERVNVAGTAAVIAAARETGVARIVFTSTTALYGASSRPASWLDEDSTPAPLTIYHHTKLAAEQLLREAAGPALAIRILRMSRCFPEPANRMAAYRLHRGVDARDVASAHALALGHRGERCHTWVISGATPLEPADLARDACAVLCERAPALVAALDARGWALPSTIDRVYSPSRASRELGWQPRFGWQEVLAAYDRGDGEVLPPVTASATSRP
jgi:nucleoside-diphosphate-sugar epimerase